MFRLFLLLLLFSYFNCSSQEYNIPFRSGELWGFADKNGTLKITPKYDSINPSMENLRWFVFQNNKVGIVNEKGEQVLKPIYDSIYRKPVHSTYNEFLVYANNLAGFADMNGNFLLPIQYKFIEKAENDSFNQLPLKFFVQQKLDSTFTLIDSKETKVLANIQEYTETHDGYYILKKDNKFGIYNTVLNEWKIKNEYDSINYFHYKDFHRPKEIYENIKYYGTKDEKFFLFDRNFKMYDTAINKFEDFFDLPNMNNYPVMTTVESTVDSRIYELKTVTGNNFNQNTSYKSHDFYKTRLKIEISKTNDKYFIFTNSIDFDRSKSKEYDEIKLLKKSYNDDYYCTFALVKIKNKWKILDLVQNELIDDIVFEKAYFHQKYKDVLLLEYKSKIGIYKIENNRSNQKSVAIKPLYDSISSFEYIYPLDDSYKSIQICYFKKKEKICPVSLNGVLFYKD